jgi:hypothetical protein
MIQFSIRLPDDMYERISAIAKKEKRSLNAQVLMMLEEVVDKDVVHDGDGRS